MAVIAILQMQHQENQIKNNITVVYYFFALYLSII